MQNHQRRPVPVPVLKQLKTYLDTRCRQIAYQAAAKATALAADFAVMVAVIFMGILTFFIASATLAFLAAEALGSAWAGFGCVAAGYLLIALTVLCFKRYFERPIIRTTIRKLSGVRS